MSQKQQKKSSIEKATRRPVFIVDGARTPFLKVRGRPGPFSPVDLALQCGRPLLLRRVFAPKSLDQSIPCTRS